MKSVFLFLLVLPLAGCATMELVEQTDFYKGRWMEVRDGDTAGKTGYNRIQTYIRDNEFLNDNPVFADAMEANGLPDYVYVIDILRFRIAYVRSKQVQEWGASDPYTLVRTYAWNDCPAPLPPGPAAAPAPEPAAAAKKPVVAAPAPAPEPAAAAKKPAVAVPAPAKAPAASSPPPPPPPVPQTFALPEMPE